MSVTRNELLALVLSAPGGVEALLRQYDTDEAAEVLGCAPSYLERDRARNSHQKIGEAVRYDVVDMLLIKERCRVDPSAARAAVPKASAPAAVPEVEPYKRIAPAGARPLAAVGAKSGSKRAR